MPDTASTQSPSIAQDRPCTPSSRPMLRNQESQSEVTRLGINDFIGDPEGLHHYTGLESYDKFLLLYNCLGQSVHELFYFNDCIPPLSPIDQLLVTVMKLRFTWDDFEICRRFKITQQMLTNIFVTWINFLCLQLEDLGFWVDRDLVRFYSPQDFYHKYPTTRVIVDGTECPMSKPKQPLAQQATFSTYKNRNTAKVLVGSTPGGLISYCSEAYGGAASDRQIVERSNMVTMCDPGDSIMADKGFNVQDLFERYDVQINIPTFFKKKNQISGKTIKSDRMISSKRVHIERLIGLAKTFKILKHPLNNTQSALGTQILKVCCYLCNFRMGIVSKTA